jgi:hypothetical protein
VIHPSLANPDLAQKAALTGNPGAKKLQSMEIENDCAAGNSHSRNRDSLEKSKVFPNFLSRAQAERCPRAVRNEGKPTTDAYGRVRHSWGRSSGSDSRGGA